MYLIIVMCMTSRFLSKLCWFISNLGDAHYVTLERMHYLKGTLSNSTHCIR